MKKFFSCVFVLLAVTHTLQAQVKDVAFASVKYNFRWMNDTTDPKEITIETMVLSLGKTMTSYRSLDRIRFDSLVKSQMAQNEISIRNGGGITIGAPGFKSGSQDAIYKYPGTGKMDRTERVMKIYVVEEPIPAINWSVEQETKDIQGLSCQKATASFRGRNYTAWFSSALPYSNGPWKLGGLPGLIVEAYDDKKEVVFEFAGFEDVSAQDIPIALPGNVVRASAKEVKQLKQAMEADPQGFMRSQMAGSGITVTNVRAGQPLSGPASKRKVYNNPIEKTAE